MDEIRSIDFNIPKMLPSGNLQSIGQPALPDQTSFSDTLSEMLGKVDDLGEKSGNLVVDLAVGRPVELHQVMLAGAKAQISLELIIEIRNKLIEAYQEISRMPV